MSEAEYTNLARNAASLWPQVIRVLKGRHPKARQSELEDCTQDAIIKLSQKIKAGWVPEKLFEWLLGTAELCYWNEWCKNIRIASLDNGIPEPGTVDPRIRRFEDGNEMEELLAEIKNPDYREVIRLVDFEGFSVEEAAKQMGKSIDATYHLKERGEREARRITEKVLGISPPPQ